jgi:hypothetical protein
MRVSRYAVQVVVMPNLSHGRSLAQLSDDRVVAVDMASQRSGLLSHVVAHPVLAGVQVAARVSHGLMPAVPGRGEWLVGVV